MAIFRAIPQGARRARGQASWLRAVQAHPAVARLRADAHRNLISIARVLANHADWVNLTTRPTWAVLMRRTGLSRSTIAAWIAWLRRAGLLGTVAHGSTPRYRPGPDDGKGNIAAEYVLAEPEDEQVSAPVDKTRTPSQGFSRSHQGFPNARVSARGGSSGLPDPRCLWSRTAVPRTKREMLRAAARARLDSPTLRRVSDRAVRHVLRPIFRAGGTLADALYAIDHRPDGSRWLHTDRPRNVVAWARYRLSAWLTEDGQLRPGVTLPSRRAAAEAEAAAARRERQRAALAAMARQACADPSVHIAAARRALEAARPVARQDAQRDVERPTVRGCGDGPAALARRALEAALRGRAAARDRALGIATEPADVVDRESAAATTELDQAPAAGATQSAASRGIAAVRDALAAVRSRSWAMLSARRRARNDQPAMIEALRAT